MTTTLVSRSASRFGLPAFLAAACFPLALSAQSVPATNDVVANDESVIRLETFVVTGSAVPAIPGQTFQPVATITQKAFEDAGSGTLSEGLRTMVPGFFGEAGTELRANGGSGAAKANLRGLGGTLTLLDGQRTVFDELNVIPLIAVQRMEIAKDGASARYGADALTGVFNTILVPSYRGGKVQVYYGNTTEEDAAVMRVGILAGAGNARTNIVVAAESYHRNALMSRDRDGSADANATIQGGLNWRDPVVSGRTYAYKAADGWQYRVLAPGKTIGTSAADFVTQTQANYYNPREATALIPEQENESAYIRLNQQILSGGRLEAFARMLYSKNKYESAVSPLAVNVVSYPGVYPATSPHFPSGMTVYYPPGYYYYLRPSVLGPRGRTYERKVYDFQFGLKGRLGGDWTWDATYLYSWWYRDDTQTNSFAYANLAAAINNGSYNPFALDSAAGVNPANNIAYDNPAALRASAIAGRIDLDAGVRGGSVRTSGTVFTVPAGRIQLAAGFDYAVNEASTVPDGVVNVVNGSYLGFNPSGFSASGSESKGAYAEVVLPLIGAKQNIRAVRDLRVTASMRRSEKEVNGATKDNAGVFQQHERTFAKNTPKAGVLYQPVRDVLLRATYAEGFRTPSLGYLFAASAASQLSVTDPLGFSPAAAVPVFSRGNPELKPETSKTWNAGIVFTPELVKGLRVELDYYRGQIRGLIADGAQYILNANAAAQGAGFARGDAGTINPAAAFSSLITRDGAGQITRIDSMPVNATGREATGVDALITYEWPVTFAKCVSMLAWNTTLSWDLTLADGTPEQNWLGRYVDVSTNSISPGSIPRNRGRFAQAYEKGAWSALGAVNYVSHLEDDSSRTSGKGFRYVDSWTTFDAQVGYRWKAAGVEARVGVNNLFNEAAPFAAGAVNSVSNASYDVTLHNDRGRFVYVQITKTF
jgi:outer membrane receptor protein involved in Fe transport